MIGCRLAGAERIVAIDLSEDRLAEARRHGATDTRVAADDTVDWIRSETGGFGADYTFEATGNVQVMQQAVEAAREAWGLATMIGVAGKGETLDIVPRLLITGRRVTGSSFGGVKGRTQVPQLVDRWLAGEIDADALVTAPDRARRGERRLRRDGAPGGHPHRDHVRLSASSAISTGRSGCLKRQPGEGRQRGDSLAGGRRRQHENSPRRSAARFRTTRRRAGVGPPWRICERRVGRKHVQRHEALRPLGRRDTNCGKRIGTA